VATARPEFAQAAGIRPSGDRFFIELEGLERDEAKHLAELAGRDDDRVVDRAEGNPLFLVELARAGSGGELPLTLQGALGARFARGRVHPEDAASLAHHWWEALRPPDGEWVWGADPDLAAMRHEGFAALQAAAQRHADHFAVDAAIELVERAAVLASNEREL